MPLVADHHLLLRSESPSSCSSGGSAVADTKTTTTLTNAHDFAIAAAKMAADTRCSNVVVLDVSAISPVTDYLVIATGTSARQMRSVCDDIEEMGEPIGFKALTRAGYEGESWILVDFVTVVVHVFAP